MKKQTKDFKTFPVLFNPDDDSFYYDDGKGNIIEIDMKGEGAEE